MGQAATAAASIYEDSENESPDSEELEEVEGGLRKHPPQKQQQQLLQRRDKSSEDKPSEDKEAMLVDVTPTTEHPPDSKSSANKDGGGDHETPEDITKQVHPQTPQTYTLISSPCMQIESIQSHLDALKAEKHRLFQQLKMVLHEEDEKKRKLEMEQKQ